MAYDTTADRKPIDYSSPIARLPFGKYKGEVMWTIGLNSLDWMLANFNLTPRGIDTINDAKQLFVRSGEYAVMRNLKGERWECKLQGIYSSRSIAEAHTNIGDGYEDFVYHIKA
jgi:hypothetical protein